MEYKHLGLEDIVTEIGSNGTSLNQTIIVQNKFESKLSAEADIIFGVYLLMISK